MSTGLLSTAHTFPGSFTAFVFTFAVATACGLVAQRKGRNRLAWSVLGFFFTILALVIVLVLPRAGRARPRPTIVDADLAPPDTDRQMSHSDIRHARTVAFPVSTAAPDGTNEGVDTDEIEAWLKTQEPPGIG
jgi:hypothetical protein